MELQLLDGRCGVPKAILKVQLREQPKEWMWLVPPMALRTAMLLASLRE
jgi:hypothetical protein